MKQISIFTEHVEVTDDQYKKLIKDEEDGETEFNYDAVDRNSRVEIDYEFGDSVDIGNSKGLSNISHFVSSLYEE